MSHQHRTPGQPTPPDLNPIRWVDEVVAEREAHSERLNEHWARKREKFEAAERAKRPQPPAPIRPPKRIRLKASCMIGGKPCKAGTEIEVLAAPVWPTGVIKVEDAIELVRSGRAEPVETTTTPAR